MEICAIVVLAFCTCFVGSNAKITNKYAIKHPQPPASADGSLLQPVVVGENGEVNNALDGPLISQGAHMDSAHHHDKHGHHGHGHQEEKDGHHGHRGVSDRGSRGHHKKGHERTEDKDHRSKSGPRLVAASREKSDDQEQADSKLCSAVKCKRRHVCVVNAESGVAECIHKKLLKQRRKKMRAARLSTKASDNLKKVRSKKKQYFRKMQQHRARQEKKAHKIVKKMKTKAEHFKDRMDEKKRHRLHHLRQLAVSDREQHSEYVTGTPVREYSAFSKENITMSILQHCSPKDLAVMGKRLLEWFKVIQDKDPHHHDHVIQKRNSMKKELHERDECICQAPVRYEFLTLDDNMDDDLSPKELGRLESNGYEHCIQPFIESCDHDLDGHLSTKEWCCCFADVLPPCLADMAMVPAAMSLGGPAVMPGAMVPQCDSDGFYKPLQCHGSTGYCWCVDRAGIQIEGTHTRGTPDCDNLDADSQAILEISNDLNDE